MRFQCLILVCCAILMAPLSAQIPAEVISVDTMPAPGSNWFIAKTSNGGYIFDAESGDMQGMLSLSRMTPAVQPYSPRREFYAAEHYYSRAVHGERTDVVTIYDFDNLRPVGEVIIPPRMARINIRGHLALMGNGSHLAVFNLTPAQSVSIVDVVERRFVGELSTPGCAVMMPVAQQDFLMLCGDGTLQLMRLDGEGNESGRLRSEPFFSVQEDPVFDRPVPTADGWLLATHRGQIFTVTTRGDEIRISEPWSLLDEEAQTEKWRPGGGHLKSVHKELGLLYIAMHQGGDSTHHKPGTEVWVFNINSQRRLQRMKFESPVQNVMVTQESQPKLIIGDEGGKTHVYDALQFRFERSIEVPDASSFEDF